MIVDTTIILDNSHILFFGLPPVAISLNLEDGTPIHMEDGATLIEPE